MEKITFQNATQTAPATVTIDDTVYNVTPAVIEGGVLPNADNLNQLQENVEEEFTNVKNNSLISIGGSVSGEKTYTISNWVWTNFNLTTVKKNIGDGFEIATDCIKCKKAMTISLSALTTFASTVNGEANARIVKNNNVVAQAVATAQDASEAQCVSIPDVVIDVLPDDIIAFQLSGVSGDYNVYDRPTMCYMTAREIK